MIKLLSEEKIGEFLKFCGTDLAGAVICTRFHAYGLNSDNALFWYIEGENGEISGVLSKSDNVLTVCPFELANREEVIAFSKITGCSQITRPGKFTLKYSGENPDFTADGSVKDITGENLKDVFPVIFPKSKNKDLFSFWYTDASHKIRHSLIHGKGVYVGEKCVSAALTSGETENTAVISSVSTLEEYRRRGFGRLAVLSLAEFLSGMNKQVFLMTDSENTKKWYEKSGFETINNINVV
ncbi:MAG: GNAT family N-acetyltransferase [Clostridiales bacterium]|nr:GNAT family N-acetyltransferase [Clostridiales bacterium]